MYSAEERSGSTKQTCQRDCENIWICSEIVFGGPRARESSPFHKLFLVGSLQPGNRVLYAEKLRSRDYHNIPNWLIVVSRKGKKGIARASDRSFLVIPTCLVYIGSMPGRFSD